MSGFNNVALGGFSASSFDYYHVHGRYHVAGITRSNDNQMFSADLKIDHVIDFTLNDFDHPNDQYYQLINNLSTAVSKIKSFRSKELADTLNFDPTGLIAIDKITNTSHGPAISHTHHYNISTLDGLEKLIYDITTHGPALEPELSSGYFINTPIANESMVKIKGFYIINGANDMHLAYNSGFKTKLQIFQHLDTTITHDSTLQDNLKHILSTALNKAEAFQNPNCKDALHFSGDVKVTYPDKPEFTYPINNLNSFKLFIDFISHLKLSAQNKADIINSSPENNKSLNPSMDPILTKFTYNRGELQREQISLLQEDIPVDGCCQRLKKSICG